MEDNITEERNNENNKPLCSHLWDALRQLLKWVGHDRLPEFVKIAASVAQPAGMLNYQYESATPPKKDGGTLTILSANLWHDWPRFKDLERRLESFAQLAEHEKADLILVQELPRLPNFKGDQWFADRMNMAYVYSRANGSERIGFEEGLGVFSRYPLKRMPYVREMGRSCNPFVRRLALGADIETPFGEIAAFSIHLGLLQKQNARQLHDLHGWVNEISLGRSAIVGGDFNAHEDTHQIRNVRSHWRDTFREIYRHGHAATHEIRWPWGGAFLSRRLDYIFLQPGHPEWQVVDVDHVNAHDGPHSDHRAVLARLSPVELVL